MLIVLKRDANEANSFFTVVLKPPKLFILLLFRITAHPTWKLPQSDLCNEAPLPICPSSLGFELVTISLPQHLGASLKMHIKFS